jgi:hypothetical protein
VRFYSSSLSLLIVFVAQDSMAAAIVISISIIAIIFSHEATLTQASLGKWNI